MIERLQVQSMAGMVGKLSFEGSAFCIRFTPVLLQ